MGKLTGDDTKASDWRPNLPEDMDIGGITMKVRADDRSTNEKGPPLNDKCEVVLRQTQ